MGQRGRGRESERARQTPGSGASSPLWAPAGRGRAVRRTTCRTSGAGPRGAGRSGESQGPCRGMRARGGRAGGSGRGTAAARRDPRAEACAARSCLRRSEHSPSCRHPDLRRVLLGSPALSLQHQDSRRQYLRVRVRLCGHRKRPQLNPRGR